MVVVAPGPALKLQTVSGTRSRKVLRRTAGADNDRRHDWQFPNWSRTSQLKPGEKQSPEPRLAADRAGTGQIRVGGPCTDCVTFHVLFNTADC